MMDYLVKNNIRIAGAKKAAIVVYSLKKRRPLPGRLEFFVKRRDNILIIGYGQHVAVHGSFVFALLEQARQRDMAAVLLYIFPFFMITRWCLKDIIECNVELGEAVGFDPVVVFFVGNDFDVGQDLEFGMNIPADTGHQQARFIAFFD